MRAPAPGLSQHENTLSPTRQAVRATRPAASRSADQHDCLAAGSHGLLPEIVASTTRCLLTASSAHSFRGIAAPVVVSMMILTRADSRGIDNFANNAVMGQAQEHAIAVVPNLIDFNASLTASVARSNNR